MIGSKFFKIVNPQYAGDDKFTCYLPMQTVYHSFLDANQFLNGYWDTYMQKSVENKRSIELFYTITEEALKSLDKMNLKPGTAYLIRFTLPINEVGEQISKGNFSKVIFDLVDCYGLLKNSENLKIIKNPNFDLYFGKNPLDAHSENRSDYNCNL